MNIRFLALLAALSALSACGDGQPFFDEDGTVDGGTDDGGTDTDGDLDSGTELPPGTERPSADRSIERFEPEDDAGGGLVTDVSYNATNDTFSVDNLGFDGANLYQRDDQVPTLSSSTDARYAVYEADLVTRDALTGLPISQLPYRAIFGVSSNRLNGEGRTSFAIVRTGGYVNYGFGGFVYERNGGVVLPTEGQAAFTGDYAGMRVFDGRGGLEYTTGDMTVAIDFEDFNANSAVRGQLTNRAAFDINGNPITLSNAEGALSLPTLVFVVREGVDNLNEDGELVGEVQSSRNGEVYEQGVYYGIIAGDMTNPQDGGEVVGVMVFESEDPRFDGVTAQETGGFILLR